MGHYGAMQRPLSGSNRPKMDTGLHEYTVTCNFHSSPEPVAPMGLVGGQTTARTPHGRLTATASTSVLLVLRQRSAAAWRPVPGPTGATPGVDLHALQEALAGSLRHAGHWGGGSPRPGDGAPPGAEFDVSSENDFSCDICPPCLNEII
jgi:hypothetical protein